MKDIFLKYLLVGFCISFFVIGSIELIANGQNNFDFLNVLKYTFVFTLCWSVGMTYISVYNAKNAPQEEQEEVNTNAGGRLYYYNDYHNGLCKVERIEYDSIKDLKNKNYNSFYSFINKEGEFITPQWYIGASDFGDNGRAIVAVKDKNDNILYNIIDEAGRELSTMWYYSIYECVDGKYKVGWNDNTINFIDSDGQLLWSDWKKELVSN